MLFSWDELVNPIWELVQMLEAGAQQAPRQRCMGEGKREMNPELVYSGAMSLNDYWQVMGRDGEGVISRDQLLMTTEGGAVRGSSLEINSQWLLREGRWGGHLSRSTLNDNWEIMVVWVLCKLRATLGCLSSHICGYKASDCTILVAQAIWCDPGLSCLVEAWAHSKPRI